MVYALYYQTAVLLQHTIQYKTLDMTRLGSSFLCSNLFLTRLQGGVGGCRCALLRAVINSWSISDSHENLVRSCCAFNYLDVFLDFVWLQGYSVSPSLWVYGNLFVSLSLSFLFQQDSSTLLESLWLSFYFRFFI